jgi:hypothetical protein
MAAFLYIAMWLTVSWVILRLLAFNSESEENDSW